MLFTRVGRVVAYFALAVGILTAVTGLFIALGFIGPNDAALARYFPRAGSTGAVSTEAYTLRCLASRSAF
jgi:hypothetical protein